MLHMSLTLCLLDTLDRKPDYYKIMNSFVMWYEKNMYTANGSCFDVNGAYRDDTPIGKLMHDFSCTDAADMHYEILADRVKFYKESKEGVLIMCKVMEDMRKESLKEGIRRGIRRGIKESAINVAQKMLADGTITLEKIAEFAGLSIDEVKKLEAGQTI